MCVQKIQVWSSLSPYFLCYYKFRLGIIEVLVTYAVSVFYMRMYFYMYVCNYTYIYVLLYVYINEFI